MRTNVVLICLLLLSQVFNPGCASQQQVAQEETDDLAGKSPTQQQVPLTASDVVKRLAPFSEECEVEEPLLDSPIRGGVYADCVESDSMWFVITDEVTDEKFTSLSVMVTEMMEENEDMPRPTPTTLTLPSGRSVPAFVVEIVEDESYEGRMLILDEGLAAGIRLMGCGVQRGGNIEASCHQPIEAMLAPVGP